MNETMGSRSIYWNEYMSVQHLISFHPHTQVVLIVLHPIYFISLHNINNHQLVNFGGFSIVNPIHRMI